MAAEQKRAKNVRLTAKTLVPLTALAPAAGAGTIYYTTTSTHTPDTTRHTQAVNQPDSSAGVAQHLDEFDVAAEATREAVAKAKSA